MSDLRVELVRVYFDMSDETVDVVASDNNLPQWFLDDLSTAIVKTVSEAAEKAGNRPPSPEIDPCLEPR